MKLCGIPYEFFEAISKCQDSLKIPGNHPRCHVGFLDILQDPLRDSTAPLLARGLSSQTPEKGGGGSGQRGRPSILTGSQESRNAHRHYLKLKQGEKKKNKKKNKEEQGGRREVEGGGGRWREEGEGGGGGDDIGIICPP